MADYFLDSNNKKPTNKNILTPKKAEAISEAFIEATMAATKAASMSETFVKTGIPISVTEQMRRLKALQLNAAPKNKQAAAENVSSATKGWRASRREELKEDRRERRNLQKKEQSSRYNGAGFRHKKPYIVQSKEILGKIRRIYKVAGSRKEHIKYKGELIPVSDYKKLMK